MIQLSLNTAAERAAALRALTVYVNALDSLSTQSAAAFQVVSGAANEVADAMRSICLSATALPPMPTGGIVTPSTSVPVISRSEAVIPAADVPDVGAPLPPLPVAVSSPELTAEQVFGTAPMTAQQAADALNGQHYRPAVPAVPAVELDAEGKPWDPELHASSKAKIGDGTWRKKRNAAPAVPTPPATPVVPTPPATPVVPTPPAAPAAPVTVPELTQALMAAMMAQKIDGLAINALCQRHGVPNIVALSQHADKAAAIMADFRATVPA